MNSVNIVIHAAALKHVDWLSCSYEYINTTLMEQNLVQALENNVEKVALSTDKAANPINLYETTKLASDKLFVSANNITGNNVQGFCY